MYMALLQERDDRLCAQTKGRLPCRFFNSFFMNKLLDEGRGYNYAGVRRWTKKFDVLVIGGGPCGTETALICSMAGKRVAVADPRGALLGAPTGWCVWKAYTEVSRPKLFIDAHRERKKRFTHLSCDSDIINGYGDVFHC